jgi:hypothetical protein
MCYGALTGSRYYHSNRMSVSKLKEDTGTICGLLLFPVDSEYPVGNLLLSKLEHRYGIIYLSGLYCLYQSWTFQNQHETLHGVRLLYFKRIDNYKDVRVLLSQNIASDSDDLWSFFLPALLKMTLLYNTCAGILPVCPEINDLRISRSASISMTIKYQQLYHVLWASVFLALIENE